jgi:hypothetical protein
MPNDKADCPKQGAIKGKADEARARLQHFKDNHPNLVADLDLQVIDDNLSAIAMDNHK